MSRGREPFYESFYGKGEKVINVFTVFSIFHKSGFPKMTLDVILRLSR